VLRLESQLTKGACILLGLRWENKELKAERHGNIRNVEAHQLYDILRPTIVERFGRKLVLDDIPPSLRVLINEHSFKRGIKKLTGNKGKKTQRLVVQCMQDQQYLSLELAYFVRGMVTIDYIHKLLERQHHPVVPNYRGHHNIHIPQLRRVARGVPINHLKSWLMTCENIDYLRDCLDAIECLVEEEINWNQISRNLTEAHDILCARANRRDQTANRKKKLEASKKWQKINGTEIVTEGGTVLKFTLPETMGDVYDWGERQQHCLGMHAASHLRRESVLVQIEEVGKNIYYHLETFMASVIHQCLIKFAVPLKHSLLIKS